MAVRERALLGRPPAARPRGLRDATTRKRVSWRAHRNSGSDGSANTVLSGRPRVRIKSTICENSYGGANSGQVSAAESASFGEIDEHFRQAWPRLSSAGGGAALASEKGGTRDQCCPAIRKGSPAAQPVPHPDKIGMLHPDIINANELHAWTEDFGPLRLSCGAVCIFLQVLNDCASLIRTWLQEDPQEDFSEHHRLVARRGGQRVGRHRCRRPRSDQVAGCSLRATVVAAANMRLCRMSCSAAAPEPALPARPQW